MLLPAAMETAALLLLRLAETQVQHMVQLPLNKFGVCTSAAALQMGMQAIYQHLHGRPCQ